MACFSGASAYHETGIFYNWYYLGIALDSFEQQHKYFSEQIIPQIIDKKYREFVFDFDITNLKLE